MNINWAIYMLGLYPEIQEKARREIDEVLGAFSGSEPRLDDLSSSHLRELKYLEQVIKETLRMWPSIPFVARQVNEDLKVGGKQCAPYRSELDPLIVNLD